MEGITAIVIVAALLSVGLIQSIVGQVSKAGVHGLPLVAAAVVIGVALAGLAAAVFPEQTAFLTLPQWLVAGGLMGFSSTGLWDFRRGEQPQLSEARVGYAERVEVD